VISMTIRLGNPYVYYPYPAPNFSRNVYQSTPYPPWMAQPAYSYKGISEMNYSQRWMTQPTVSDGGLSEFGLSNYAQTKWIQTAPMISPTCYPAPMFAPYPPMMTQPEMGYGQPCPYPMMGMGQPVMSPSFYPSASPMSYSQPQTWPTTQRIGTSMFRYY
jgi:hypothetical protein